MVLHYTGMQDRNSALDRLCDPDAGVSAHWLIDEDGIRFALVPEVRRAWHAGQGSWQSWSDVNSVSVGVELVNPGHEFGYRPFPETQVTECLALVRELLDRYQLDPRRVIGHSDLAPLRKQDPGELFPWRRLAGAGLALWPRPTEPVPGPVLEEGMEGREVECLQQALVRIGYGLGIDGRYGAETRAVVLAFQRRFHPERVDGMACGVTRARALVLARDSQERSAGLAVERD